MQVQLAANWPSVAANMVTWCFVHSVHRCRCRWPPIGQVAPTLRRPRCIVAPRHVVVHFGARHLSVPSSVITLAVSGNMQAQLICQHPLGMGPGARPLFGHMPHRQHRVTCTTVPCVLLARSSSLATASLARVSIWLGCVANMGGDTIDCYGEASPVRGLEPELNPMADLQAVAMTQWLQVGRCTCVGLVMLADSPSIGC